jgi:hypothetical protein
MKKIALLSVLVFGLGLAALAAVNVTGTWVYTMKMGDREMTQDMTFAQNGEKLTVTMTRMGRDGNAMETKGEGTVKGNDIEWKITRQGRDGQEMTTTYKGTIVDDNNMKGTMEGGFGRPGGGGGEMAPPEWTAVRKAQ